MHHDFDLDDRSLERWFELCDDLLDADAPWQPTQTLGARICVAELGGIVLLEMHTREVGLALARGPERVARERFPTAMGLTLVTRGEAQIQTRGREHVVRAGELCLLSSLEAFDKRLSADYSELFLYLPLPIAESLSRPVPALAQHTLIAPQRGLGAMLADGMQSLRRVRHEMSPGEWSAALGAVFELAAGVFGRSEPERVGLATREVQRARAVRYLEQHLVEPELSPRTIAAGLGMSLRYLHLLFEHGDSVGATILARRLEHCRRVLATDPRSISEIAFAHGFNDAAHFSRTFKARFGRTPRDVRNEQRPPELVSAAGRDGGEPS
jgi:AraC family transcriptional activator of tynA and feaB